MSDRQPPARAAQIRAQSNQQWENGKEGRDGAVSKCTNESLGLLECLVEKQVHKRKIALTTAIMLSFIFFE